MRTSIVVILLIALAMGAQASIAVRMEQNPKPELELCSICVSLMDQALSQLINIIANGGVIGGCADLCAYLPNQVEQAACDLICDYFGIEGFMKLLQSVDPEPIWLCEEMFLCTINDNARGNITAITPTPKSAPVGTTINVHVVFTVLNTIGTGQIVVEVVPPQGDILESDQLLINTKPGQYSLDVSVETTPGQDEPFVAGTYTIVAGLCEGECGSSHSHSYLLDEKKATFTLTN